ncbi:MAG: HEAT repeat domain-containing protein [Candidatus Omnitrophota bacterium]|nr:HEAT repeat domain-containing protein [Candidatus Omnitrophota bacterium]MDZ4243305.1 HEAT repeat domain-containing protein [Candidatus Omnitrophota bacterium]
MTDPTPETEKPFLKVILHSFFVIPFLIAVFCVLLFAGVRLLTRENQTAYDFLNDVKTGGLTKRWQAAFELSRVLANPQLIPQEERFQNEMISAFQNSRADDDKVRRYLALAMGRTGDPAYLKPLANGLKDEKEATLDALIYAIGTLKDERGSAPLYPFLDHPDSRVRSLTVAALGNIGADSSKTFLKKSLNDPEPNVQWGSAISLARMGDSAGEGVLFQLLNREYLSKFPEVDPYEQNHLILTALDAASRLDNPELIQKITWISQNDPNMAVRTAAMKVIQKK